MLPTSFPGPKGAKVSDVSAYQRRLRQVRTFNAVFGLLKAKSGPRLGARGTLIARSRIVVTMGLTLLLSSAALAQGFRAHELIVSDPVTGAAILGFDPVAYQLERRAVPGRPEHQTSFGGKSWHFTSSANLAQFKASPEAFLPGLGGHDPVAVAAGLPVAGNPRHHAIRDGRLFLFRTPENRDTFLEKPGILAEAQRVWPEVQRGLSP
jgi:YHS domain-containing protein